MNELHLLDDHRRAWEQLLGQRALFRGTIARFGHKHRQGATIKRGATLVLTSVHRVHSSHVIDHVWVAYTPQLAQYGEHLRPNGIIEFSAVVTAYEKGGKHSYGRTRGQFEDLGLSSLTHVRIIKEPYLPKSYPALMDDAFLSYVIATHQNLKTGTVIGRDPRGFLGTIRIGQGCCNRLAKKLSWQWINLLPAKYGGGLTKL